MPISNTYSAPPRHDIPRGAHPESAVPPRPTLRFRTQDFERVISVLPPEKQSYARNLFPKDSTGHWMKSDKARYEAFVNSLDPVEREDVANILRKYRISFVSNLAAPEPGPRASRPTPEPGPHGPSAFQGMDHAYASSAAATYTPGKPHRHDPARAQPNSHSTSQGGPDAQPEKEGGKGIKGLWWKIPAGLLGAFTLAFLMTPLDKEENKTATKPPDTF